METRFDFKQFDNIVENGEKRHKIKAKKVFEHEIDEENKRVTLNAITVGALSLGIVVCFASLGNENIELTQRVGMGMLGLVGSKGVYGSVMSLVESISRKIQLEEVYDFKFKDNNEKKR